jgi:GTP-binding protein
MFNLEATENQLDFPTVYGSAKEGWMSDDLNERTDNISAVLDSIVEHIPAPDALKGTPQMLITSLEYSNYVGRIAIGRLHRGVLKTGQDVSLVKTDNSVKRIRIKELHVFDGLGRTKVDEVSSGEICALVGIEGFDIGDTVADRENPEALDPISIDEPTMSMLFTINNSPFFGKEGKLVTSRHIKDRLDKELEKNLALRVETTSSADAWNVFGRGVLHLSVLIETMRREGYELQVGQPRVIIKDIAGEKNEPIEELTIDLPDEYSGKAIEMVSQRKGELVSMERKGERIHLEFKIPSRGIIGIRSNMMTATAGEAILAHRFVDFEPWKGPIEKRINGSIIAMESGTAIAYGMDKLQDRGKFFIHPGEPVYMGQVVGENNREGDLTVNVTKTKKMSNMRSSGADDKVKLTPPQIFTLEEALEYIQGDEYVEVTPKSIRLRKIMLFEHERKKLVKQK